VCLYNPVNHGQTESGAFTWFLGCEIRLKNSLQSYSTIRNEYRFIVCL
jgi:hypothetical protein